MQGDQVVGVAFQNLPHAENIGYIIPTPVVRHFLSEVGPAGCWAGMGGPPHTMVLPLHFRGMSAGLLLPATGGQVRHVCRLLLPRDHVPEPGEPSPQESIR